MSLSHPLRRSVVAPWTRQFISPKSHTISTPHHIRSVHNVSRNTWSASRVGNSDRVIWKGRRIAPVAGCHYSAPSSAKRAFSSSPAQRHGHLDPPKPGEERKVTFVEKDGTELTFEVADGDNLLDIAQANDIEMEGACGGSCACSTCHVIIESEDYYDKMPEPEDDENDMLDLAFGLTETSRLGCQVKMTKELDGLKVKLPQMTRNMQASDFAEKRA